MNISDIVTNGTLALDPKGNAAWIADAMPKLLTGPARFSAATGAANRYLNPGIAVWENENTVLELDTTSSGDIQKLRFIRPFLDGVLAGETLSSVSDYLQLEIATWAGGVTTIQRASRWFQARLSVGGKHLDVKLTPMGFDQLELDAGFDAGEGPSLGDVFRLLGYASSGETDVRSDLSWLPDELRTGSIVEIADFHGMLKHESTDKEEPVALPGQRGGATGCTILNIGAGLRFLDGRSWNLIPGYDVLKAGDLRVELDLDYPLDPIYRFPRVDVSGVITIHAGTHPDAHIELLARWPDYSISGKLRDGEEVPLGAVLEQFGVPAGKLPDGNDSLIIADFSIEAEPVFTPRSFSLALGVRNVWKFDVGNGKTLDIERINAFVDYQGGDAGYLTARLSAQFTIAGVGCLVSAAASDAGWEFSGSLYPADGTTLLVGPWVKSLASQLGVSEQAIPKLVEDFGISRVEVSLNTASQEMSFRLVCTAKLNGQTEIDAELAVHYSNQKSELAISGRLTIGGRQFDLAFDKDKSDTRLLAVYSNANKDQFDLGELLGQVSSAAVPQLLISLSSMEFALDKSDKGTIVLAGLDMGGTINLAELPLVGSMLSGDHAVTMSLQVLYCSDPKGAATPGLIGALQSLLPSGSPTLPDKDKIASFNLTPTLQIGTDRYQLSLPVGVDDQGKVNRTGAAGNPSAVRTSSPGKTSNAGGVSWFPIQKKFGPVYLSRIGGRYQAGEAQFLIDATLQLGPLTFSLDGLSVSTPLTSKDLPFSLDPKFSLSGLGLGLTAGPVSISGAFLHDPVSGDYNGAASLSFKELTLSAIGSYTEIAGRKSLFLYALLNYPLGGPSFFFVEGIAAGFGYNRAFIPPPLAQVHEFPLIVEAAKGGAMPTDVSGEIEKLRAFIPAKVDQYFLVAGIKFNSFKLIDSVALVAVSFGSHFEVDVLGYSQLELPREADPKVAPLAVIDMELRAVVNPDAGIISVEADLTPTSHLFSDACRITGGFAFYSWISGEHSGDFVVTLGGYHPSFIPPAHYPTPDKVALNWQYNDSLQIKGDLYFALTPSAVMAGGHLEVTYHSGSIRAWLKAGADFLMLWKPYHYDASMYVDIGGSADIDLLFCTKTITIDVGASLHLWGPDLAGTATVNLYVFSFDISFGAGPSLPPPMEWPEFKASFIPAKSQVTVTIADGLVETIKQVKVVNAEDVITEVPVINPQHLRLVTDSVIPIKTLQFGGESLSPASWRQVGIDDSGETLTPYTDFSVAPMGIIPSQFLTTHDITIKKDDKIILFKENHFEVTGLLKNQPKSLWQDRSAIEKPSEFSASELSADMMLNRLCSGVEITAKPPIEPSPVTLTPTPNLQSLPSGAWQATRTLSGPGAIPDPRSVIARDILDSETIKARNQLMADFGLKLETLDLPAALIQDFRVAPLVESQGGGI